MKTLVLSFILLLFAAPANSQDVATNQAEVDKFAAAVSAGDLATVSAAYSDDAVVLPSGAPMAKGRAEIEAYWKAAFEQIDELKVTVTDVKMLGDAAMREIGTFTVRTKGDQPQEATGKFVTILEKEGDAWKITTDIWNEDTMAPPG